MGKSTISMAIFNSYVSHYQRVSISDVWIVAVGGQLVAHGAHLTSGHQLVFQHSLQHFQPRKKLGNSAEKAIYSEFSHEKWDYNGIIMG